MNIIVYEDYEELSRNTALMIAETVKLKPDALLCLPAGNTPAGTFRVLIELKNAGKVDFSHCKFVGLDEWVGMGRYDDGSCQSFLHEQLFAPLGILEAQIRFFDAKAADLSTECKAVDQWIKRNGPIDLMYVGLGMNGHIGLNEPGVDFTSSSHVVNLDTTTKTIGQKYFQKQTRLEQGITLGLGQVMEARTVLLGVSGLGKAEIVRQVARGDVSNHVPGSMLQRHPNSLLMLDRSAASSLGG